MLSELKTATRPEHQHLEKIFLETLRRIGTVQDYARVLKMLYPFYAGLETAAWKFVPAALVPDRMQRRTSAAIISDLQNVGSLVTVQSAVQFSYISDLSTAAGALYVAEGSTLGGEVISSMLGRQVAIPPSALTFFNYYKGNAQNMWETFKANLLQDPAQLDQQRMAEGASLTFKTFAAWLQQNNTR